MIVLPRLLRNYLTIFQIWLLVTNEIRHYMSKKPYVNDYRAFVWRLLFLPKAKYRIPTNLRHIVIDFVCY